jgi:putative FmdB family regulatory protein
VLIDSERGSGELMPIYKYTCEKCGSHVEVIQKVSDPPLKRCSKCRGKLAKAVSRTSFQLKGSGWYATDYPATKSASEKKAKTEKSEDKPDKVPADKKTESVSKHASGDKD